MTTREFGDWVSIGVAAGMLVAACVIMVVLVRCQ